MLKSILKTIRFFIFLGLSLVYISCQKKENDPAPEDYDTLFPWKGIEKPESGYEDMNVLVCDANMLLASYRYMGVTIENPRTYIVTIETSFTEGVDAHLNGYSDYEVRYIDPNKSLISVGSNPAKPHLSTLLTSGSPYSTSFKVVSGYPMYLSVNGKGNRSSSIKAKISAKSEDGVIVVPDLSSEQHQNEEGMVGLSHPYCEYIILP